MVKKSILLCLILVVLNQGVNGDVMLTLQSDRSDYELGENALFTATLKNMSQQNYFYLYGAVEYRFSVSRDGNEVWRWSKSC